jgi:uncharacterized protein (TIGR03437 family)
MKKHLLLVCAMVAGGVIASADTVETIPFRAVLAATNETTAVVDAKAIGRVTVWLHVVRDTTGKVTSGSFEFAVSYQFSGPTTLTAMHIHKGPAGVAGAIVVPVTLARTDDPTGVGTLSARQVNFSSADSTTAVIDTANGLLADPSQFYFNIHTPDAPAGAMRGQLQRAEMVVLMGQMSPTNETPTISSSTGLGIGTVVALRTLDKTFSLTSAEVIFDVNYTGFPSDTNFTGLHVHLGGTGKAGPVTIDSTLKGPVAAAASGTGNLHYDVEVDLGRAGAIDSVYALFQSPADTYINVHTSVFPGGAARAQLHRTDHAIFQATMTPAEETPPIVGLAAATPAALHVYTLRNPDGSVPVGALIFDVNPRFPTGTNFTAMHVHDGAPGVAGPVTLDSKLSGTPVIATDGTGNIWRLATMSSTAQISSLNDLVQSPEKHYLNLHTTANPGGATRVQLGPATTPAPFVSAAISSVSDASRTTGAPNALMSVYGSNLAAVPSNLDGFVDLNLLPKQLNGTSATVGGTAAPLVLVSPDQVIVQVPALTAGSQPVVITNGHGKSNTFQMPVQDVSPNIYFDSVGGIVVKWPTYQLVRPDNPAAAGDLLIAFSTGLGITASTTVGQLPTAASATATATVTVGGKDAPVLSSVNAAGFPGLYQTAFTMPSGVAPGTAAVKLTVGGASSNSVSIAVK